MKTKVYKILYKNKDVVYVGVTCRTLKARFREHLKSKSLNPEDYSIIEVDSVEHPEIDSIEIYYEERRKVAALEKKYIREELDKGSALLNLSSGGEWGGSIFAKLKESDFFNLHGSYDGYKKYLRIKAKSQNWVRNWINNRSTPKPLTWIRCWILVRGANKTKVWVKSWVYGRGRTRSEKVRDFLKNWVRNRSFSKTKRYIENWTTSRGSNKTKRWVRNWVLNRNFNKVKRWMSHWAHHKSTSRTRAWLDHWIEHRGINKTKKYICNWVKSREGRHNRVSAWFFRWVRTRSRKPTHPTLKFMQNWVYNRSANKTKVWTRNWITNRVSQQQRKQAKLNSIYSV